MGSEMCIRDRVRAGPPAVDSDREPRVHQDDQQLGGDLVRRRHPCLLYTSDAADERSSVDLGGRRIIKKKKNICADA